MFSLITVYKEVNTIKGKRSVEELNDFLLLEEDEIYLENSASEESFQENIQKHLFDLSITEAAIEKKQPRRPPIRNQEGKEVYGRRVSVSAAALEEAGYKCIVDPSHVTFISKATKNPYVESHHIIPLSKQEEFEYELDQIANITALCPNCHRLIHYGTDEQREELLRKLFVLRRDRLENIGVEVTFSTLRKMYNFDLE